MLAEDEDTVARELNLVPEVYQGDERQLLKIAHKEEGNVEFKLQHAEDVKQTQKRGLKCLLGEFEEEKGIADPGARMPEAVEKRGVYTSLHNLILFTSILDEYVNAGRKSNSGLFSENEFADDEQKKSVAKGQEGEVATPMVAADATWGMTPAGVVSMLIACETAEAALLAATKIEGSSRWQDYF